jgi:hypothetical protein
LRGRGDAEKRDAGRRDAERRDAERRDAATWISKILAPAFLDLRVAASLLSASLFPAS